MKLIVNIPIFNIYIYIYQIFSYFFTVTRLAVDDRKNLFRFPGNSTRYSPRQSVHTVPGVYLASNSIGYGDLFDRNKRHGRESDFSHSRSDEFKNFYSYTHSPKRILGAHGNRFADQENQIHYGRRRGIFHDMHYF